MADENTITVLKRFKIELNDTDIENDSDKNYMKDSVYTMYLSERGLTASNTYDNTTMRRKLFQTLYDVFNVFANNLNIYFTHTKEFETVGEAYTNLQSRLNYIQNEICHIADPDTTDDAPSQTGCLFRD